MRATHKMCAAYKLRVSDITFYKLLVSDITFYKLRASDDKLRASDERLRSTRIGWWPIDHNAITWLCSSFTRAQSAMQHSLLLVELAGWWPYCRLSDGCRYPFEMCTDVRNKRCKLPCPECLSPSWVDNYVTAADGSHWRAWSRALLCMKATLFGAKSMLKMSCSEFISHE